jgi:hypothetical protein
LNGHTLDGLMGQPGFGRLALASYCFVHGGSGSSDIDRAPPLVKFGARHPNVVAGSMKGLSFQAVRIEGPCQTPKQEIVTKVTYAAAQPQLTFDNLEAVASSKTDPLLLAHLAAKRRFAMQRDYVRIGDEVDGEQSQGAANLPIHQGASGHGRAVLRNHRQMLVPQMQFYDGIARSNEHPVLEQDIASSGTQSDTEDASEVVGIFRRSN